MPEEGTRWTRWRSALVIAVLLALSLAGTWLVVRGGWVLLTDPDEVARLLAAAGPWAPAIFVLLTALQVLLFPIPGQVLAIAGGALFGANLGTLYGLLGLVLGSTAAFWLARRFGRPFVERHVGGETLDRFDAYVGKRGQVGVLVVFLLPGLPDDAVCFVAGLSLIPIRRLVLLALLGRAPALYVSALLGEGVAQARLLQVAIALAVLGIATVVLVWNRRRLGLA